jgi:alkaline phosphatase D
MLRMRLRARKLLSTFPGTLVLALALAGVLSTHSGCSMPGEAVYQSQWEFSPDGPWTGPELWANRLQDWRVAGGRVECLSTRPMRTLHLTTLRLREGKGYLACQVEIERISGEDTREAAAGFLLGAGRHLDHRAASLIHHAWGPQAGLFVGMDGHGRLFIRDFEHKEKYLAQQEAESRDWSGVLLKLRVESREEGFSLVLEAADRASRTALSTLRFEGLTADRLIGNLALVSHSGEEPETAGRFAFKDWRVSGSKLEYHAERTPGPLVTVLFTLSRGVMKLSAQFMPLSPEENQQVDLYIRPNAAWERAASSVVRRPSYTALFRIENWAYPFDVPFRIEYTLSRRDERLYSLEGVIKRDPVHKERLTMVSMSCVKQVVKPSPGAPGGVDQESYPWDWGVLYPHADLAERLKKHDPDVLFFAGDQIYESASPTRADRESPFLDYLYKWYLWCITNRPLTSRIPTIAIPDDHDVYHGNIWGAGGIATPPGLQGAAAQDFGGYKMSPEFVNMVQETQSGCLPDPVDPRPVEQGIGVYFTECNIGGLSIAVIEDRKFKSAPRPLLPEGDIVNGWVQNQGWDVKQNSRIPNATLLGQRQLDFLDLWAGDWSNQTWMKAVVSQTLFSNVATLPRDAKSDGVVPSLEIPDPGTYVQGDKQVADFDSNGWPQVGRDKALRRFRKAFATHIVGDQHLASTSQYGVKEWRDSGFVIVSPATGNIWPRRWWPPVPGKNRSPGAPDYTGDFEDGFGNKVTVLAVANPRKTTIHPPRHHELVPGYSVITFDKASRDIQLANWPYWANPDEDQPFAGWPIRINQLDNFGKQARAWLPEIRVTGLPHPVIQVILQETEEVVYTLRMAGSAFRPKVFAPGTYTVRVGEPDTGTWKELPDLTAEADQPEDSVEVVF